jgi:excisionase family DNA binding protein
MIRKKDELTMADIAAMPYITITQAARLLNVTKPTIHRYIRDGLPARKTGAGKTAPTMIIREELDEYMRSRPLTIPFDRGLSKAEKLTMQVTDEPEPNAIERKPEPEPEKPYTF